MSVLLFSTSLFLMSSRWNVSFRESDYDGDLAAMLTSFDSRMRASLLAGFDTVCRLGPSGSDWDSCASIRDAVSCFSAPQLVMDSRFEQEAVSPAGHPSVAGGVCPRW